MISFPVGGIGNVGLRKKPTTSPALIARAFVSSDGGSTFTAWAPLATDSTYQRFNTLRYLNGNWYALADFDLQNFSNAGAIYRVSGNSASVVASITNTGPTGIAYGNGAYVAPINNTTRVFRSTNGSSFSNLQNAFPVNNTWTSDIAFGNGKFIVCCYRLNSNEPNYIQQSDFYSSADGITFTGYGRPGCGDETRKILFANGIFMTAAASSGAVRISTTTGNGTWTEKLVDSSPIAQGIYDLQYCNGTWVLVGENRIYTSTNNGSTWLTASNSNLGGGPSVAYDQVNNRIFVLNSGFSYCFNGDCQVSNVPRFSLPLNSSTITQQTNVKCPCPANTPNGYTNRYYSCAASNGIDNNIYILA